MVKPDLSSAIFQFLLLVACLQFASGANFASAQELRPDTSIQPVTPFSQQNIALTLTAICQSVFLAMTNKL